MMVEHLRQEVTSHTSRNLLNIRQKIGASWSAQVLRQAGVMLSAAFLLLFLLKTTSSLLLHPYTIFH